MKKTLANMLTFQAVLLHFLNPDDVAMAELSGGAIGSSHGEPMVAEKTREFIVTKLAERLIGTAEKCAPAPAPAADTPAAEEAEPVAEEERTCLRVLPGEKV